MSRRVVSSCRVRSPRRAVQTVGWNRNGPPGRVVSCQIADDRRGGGSNQRRKAAMDDDDADADADADGDGDDDADDDVP